MLFSHGSKLGPVGSKSVMCSQNGRKTWLVKPYRFLSCTGGRGYCCEATCITIYIDDVLCMVCSENTGFVGEVSAAFR